MRPRLLSPCLSDKLIDWRLTELAGGQSLFVGKNILELGPSFGLDLINWAPWANSYTMLDSDPTIIDHITSIILWQKDQGVSTTLIPHNMQEVFPLPDNHFDVVIDFGTVDNILASYFPYLEALRVLKPGGILLSTYANFRQFGEPWSACGDEQRFDPKDLTRELGQFGNILVRMNEDQVRAGIAVVKR